MGKRVFITAAEVSGDLHASHLIRALRRLAPDLTIEGHGGPRMREAGATIHHETTARAAMGVSALGRVREMLGLLRKTREMFKKMQPDLQICVDSPALNFHFAKAAHAVGTPVLYYVAPQLWAWREGRMKKVRRWVDRVACILPFEEEYFRSHGVDATFVGHPLLDEIIEDGQGERWAEPILREADAPVVGLLAGSRASEARKNFPRMLEVAARVRERFAGARFLLPTTPATHGIVVGMLEGRADRDAYEVREGAFDEMVPRCDLVVTVSGTATLHVALHGTPMVVVYYGSPVTWNAVGRWLIRTRTYTLVNLLSADGALAASGRVTPAMHVVPEFIPWYGSTGPAAACVVGLLERPERLAEQRRRLGELREKLGGGGASERVARMAVGMLGMAKMRVPPEAAGKPAR
jgi:lipid-A-disaccharide synthase